MVDRGREHVRRDGQARSRRGPEPRRERPEARRRSSTPSQGLFDYPTGGSDANNVQGAAYWRVRRRTGSCAASSRRARASRRSSSASARGSARRSRIPTSSPSAPSTTSSAGPRSSRPASTSRRRLFYADVEDMIQTVVVEPGPPQITQTQNVGDGEFYGVELGVQHAALGCTRASQRTTRTSSARSPIRCSRTSRSSARPTTRRSSRSSTSRRASSRSRRVSSSRATAGATSRAAATSARATTRC